MRTEDDLRGALRLMAERALDAEPTPVRERRVLRPRRLIAIAVVAAIVAAVIAVPQLLRRDATAPVAPPAYGWQPFGLRLPAGWARVVTQLDPNSSSAAISGPADKSCTVTVFKLGAFDPATIGGSKQRLTVNGHP